MSLALDEVTLGGLNGGGAREEGMSGEVISVVRLREKNNVVSWRGNDLWEGSPVVSLLPLPVLDTEIINTHGSRRKVRLLLDVIQSVLSPEERVLAAKCSSRKGHGRSRKKVVSTSIIADISLSDSYLRNRKEAILKETASTGLGSSVKRKVIRTVLRQQRVKMVFLVETKLEVVSDSLIKSIWWMDSFMYVFSPLVGLSGGLIIVWKFSKFTIHDVCRDSRFLLVSGIWVLEEWNCGMIVVYATCVTGEQLVCL
ncbi:hypothetical protein V6N13_098573 [Hibiscus sabdariffa]